MFRSFCFPSNLIYDFLFFDWGVIIWLYMSTAHSVCGWHMYMYCHANITFGFPNRKYTQLGLLRLKMVK